MGRGIDSIPPCRSSSPLGLADGDTDAVGDALGETLVERDGLRDDDLLGETDGLSDGLLLGDSEGERLVDGL